MRSCATGEQNVEPWTNIECTHAVSPIIVPFGRGNFAAGSRYLSPKVGVAQEALGGVSLQLSPSSSGWGLDSLPIPRLRSLTPDNLEQYSYGNPSLQSSSKNKPTSKPSRDRKGSVEGGRRRGIAYTPTTFSRVSRLRAQHLLWWSNPSNRSGQKRTRRHTDGRWAKGKKSPPLFVGSPVLRLACLPGAARAMSVLHWTLLA